MKKWPLIILTDFLRNSPLSTAIENNTYTIFYKKFPVSGIFALPHPASAIASASILIGFSIVLSKFLKLH